MESEEIGVLKHTLQAITVFSLFTNNIENGVDQLSAFCVMTFGPIVTSTGLSEDKVIRAEDLAVGARSDAVHGPRFEIHKNSSRNVPSARCLIVIDIDSFELDVGVSKTVVLSGGIYAVLVADDLPEFGTDLVATLASLNVQDLSHVSDEGRKKGRERFRVWSFVWRWEGKEPKCSGMRSGECSHLWNWGERREGYSEVKMVIMEGGIFCFRVRYPVPFILQG